MRVSEAESLVGKIVTLDLVNQSRVTTKIEAVEKEVLEHGTTRVGMRVFLKCKEALMFVRPNPQNPGQIAVINYGYPDTGRMKIMYIPLDTVIMVLPTDPGLVAKFSELTSGIVAAPAGLNLDGLGDAMSKITAKS